MAKAKTAAPKKGSPQEVEVLLNGEVIRSYSLEEHGEDYLKLAEEFAGKVEGREVKPVE